MLRTVKRLLLRIVFFVHKVKYCLHCSHDSYCFKNKSYSSHIDFVVHYMVNSLTESVCSPEKDCWFFVSNKLPTKSFSQ